VKRHLFLIGMMGAGKSTVAAIVAARLGWPLLDSDAVIEQATGHTVAEIFATEGEAAFRALERKALVDAVSADEPAVVAVAGGAVLDPANRELLKSAGTVVWLRARPETLAGRVHEGDHRPLLEGDAPGALKRLAAERAPYYTELADVEIDVDERKAEDVAEEVLAAVGEPPPA
jgi:shikimate kinase